jgi:hypothetical protein
MVKSLLEELIVFHLLKKFCTFHGNSRSIAMFTTTCHYFLS